MNSLCLQAGNRRPILAVLEEHHIHPLLHHGLDLLHHLVAVVAYADVDRNLLPVVVQLLVQGGLQLQLPGAQHEVFTHDGARLAALLGRGELYLAYAERDRAASVRAVVLVVSRKCLDVVLHAARFPLILLSGLERHGCRSAGRDVEGEGECVGTQLLQETLL